MTLYLVHLYIITLELLPHHIGNFLSKGRGARWPVDSVLHILSTAEPEEVC